MAWLGLRRAPGSSALAVVILALGLAAPATFFSLLVGAIRPLPVPGGDLIVRVDVLQPARDGRPETVRLSDLDLLSGAAGLESLGAFRTFGGVVVDPGRAAVRIAGAALTPEVLPMLRVTPSVGRIPTLEEAATTIMLGHDVWQEGYGGDPAALGRTVDVNGELRSIVGVLPEGFGFPFKQTAWVLLATDPLDSEPVELVGRLTDGATSDAVQTELAGRWSRGDALREADEQGGVLQVESYTGSRGEGGEAVAFVGLVLVALALLLIACANVANLLLVRATERVRALGIQAALGAGRIQIGAQLLLEALLLAAAGGAVGLALAYLAVDAIQQGLATEHFGYFWMRMAVDGRVVAFASVLVVGTALVAGTLPALRVWKVDVQRVLKEEGASAGMGGGGAWGRAFVTVQLALSCAALVAAGLSGRSLSVSGDFGGTLPTEEILVASFEFGAGSTDQDRLTTMLDQRLAAVPSIGMSALALGAPAFSEPFARFELDGDTYERAEDREGTIYNAVTPGYFDLIGLELRTGRDLLPTDARQSAPVAVVNESFARNFSGERDVLGRRVRVMSGSDSLAWRTIVGVMEDVDVGGGEGVPRERVYLPLTQVEATSVTILARAPGDGARLAGPVREAMGEVDPSIPLWGLRTLSDAHDYMIRVPRVMGAMALGGGVAGLLVAAVGLYGLLAFRVRQRRRELGVRLALGADGRSLAGQTLSFAMKQVMPALVVGLTVAWFIAPILGVFLLGLDPRAVGTYAGVAASFLTVSLLAAALPAVRASRIDPAQVLRGD
jgi:predicted permease